MPVADVRLDQALVPVGRRGVLVELVERRPGTAAIAANGSAPSSRSRARRRSRWPNSAAAIALIADLVLQRGRQLGVLGEPLEGRELAVGDRAEQVDDGLRGRPASCEGDGRVAADDSVMRRTLRR